MFFLLLGCSAKIHSESERAVWQKNERIHIKVNCATSYEELKSVSDQVVSILVTDRNFSDSDVAKLTQFQNLECLDLSKTSISDKSADVVSAFKNLRSLVIRDTKLGNRFFETANLNTLESLYASNCCLTDLGAGAIDAFSNLRVLDVSGNEKLGNTIFEIFKHSPNLEEIYLEGTAVNDIDIDFCRLSLRALGLGGCQINESSVAQIAGIKSLQILDLSRNQKINDRCLLHFHDHPELVDLCLGDTAITAKAFSSLSKIPYLQRLHIFDCSISNSELESSLIKMPNLNHLDISGVQISEESKSNIRENGINVISNW